MYNSSNISELIMKLEERVRFDQKWRTDLLTTHSSQCPWLMTI